MQTSDIQREIFKASHETQDGVTHLHLTGALDMAAGPALDESLAVAAAEGSAGTLVHLSDVTFMDSSGLRSFLRAAEEASRAHRTFLIAGARPAATKIFALTETTHLLGQMPERVTLAP